MQDPVYFPNKTEPLPDRQWLIDHDIVLCTHEHDRGVSTASMYNILCQYYDMFKSKNKNSLVHDPNEIINGIKYVKYTWRNVDDQGNEL
jgi:hypothetical protein